MALGDKLPVVMGKEKAVAGGVATLDADGKLVAAQKPAYTGEEIPVSGTDGTSLSSALSNKADLTLSNLSDRQKALANIGGRPRKNLIRNWYFVGGGSQQGGGQLPINQRGQTSYTGGATTTPCFDGWFLGPDLTADLERDFLLLTTGAATKDYYFCQNLVSDGEPYTFSVFVGTFTGNFTPMLAVQKTGGDYVFYAMETVTQNSIASVTVSVPEGTTFRVMFFWRGASNCTAEVIAMGAEHGEGQTLGYPDSTGAWQLFETPDYLETLQQCQRYLYVAEGATDCAASFGGNGLGFNLAIPVGVEMAQNLNISYGTLIGCGSNGIVFNSTGGDTFTPSTVVAVGNTVHVSGTMGAQTSAASQGFTAIFTGLVITGSD